MRYAALLALLLSACATVQEKPPRQYMVCQLVEVAPGQVAMLCTEVFEGEIGKGRVSSL